MTTGHSHIAKYLLVFAALMTLTGITVGISYLHLGIAGAVLIAMLVASTKGSLVAAYFMHLIGENKIIFFVLGLTLAFFIVLLSIPVLVATTDYRVH